MRTKNQEPAKISMGHLVKRDTCFSRPQAKRVGGAPAIIEFRERDFRSEKEVWEVTLSAALNGDMSQIQKLAIVDPTRLPKKGICGPKSRKLASGFGQISPPYKDDGDFLQPLPYQINTM
jgi:hypothetical protein